MGYGWWVPSETALPPTSWGKLWKLLCICFSPHQVTILWGGLALGREELILPTAETQSWGPSGLYPRASDYLLNWPITSLEARTLPDPLNRICNCGLRLQACAVTARHRARLRPRPASNWHVEATAQARPPCGFGPISRRTRRRRALRHGGQAPTLNGGARGSRGPGPGSRGPQR